MHAIVYNLDALKTPLTTREEVKSLIWAGREDKPAVIQMHEDGGHGWLQVPKQLLHHLGIAGKITSYSYEDKDNAYLEEDCDLSEFMKALGIGYTPEDEALANVLRNYFWNECPNNYKDHSPIRNLPHYKVN